MQYLKFWGMTMQYDADKLSKLATYFSFKNPINVDWISTYTAEELIIIYYKDCIDIVDSKEKETLKMQLKHHELNNFRNLLNRVPEDIFALYEDNFGIQCITV